MILVIPTASFSRYILNTDALRAPNERRAL
jgi:hypothetical protein